MLESQGISPRALPFLPRAGLADLVKLLIKQGYTVIAPMLKDGAIVLGPIGAAEEMAHGLLDRQSQGKYRVEQGDPELTFEYAVGPDGLKRYLFPPVQRMYQIHVEGEEFVLDAGPPQAPKLAFVGARPCDLAAMKIYDRVFGQDDPGTMRGEAESYYAEARREVMVIVVNCTRAGGNCFCVSMGTGPQAVSGFDLALTELRVGFVMEAGSERGKELAAQLPTRTASAAELELAELKVARAREGMNKELDRDRLKRVLDGAVEHPQWDDVAKRCLTCGNCTMVCPTCFCSTVTETTELTDPKVTRMRQWASCFTHQFSYTTSGPLRNSIRGRYRHWLRHKHCTWMDQFGTSGCVGCGRCITWCPVGIDITEEARRILEETRSP